MRLVCVCISTYNGSNLYCLVNSVTCSRARVCEQLVRGRYTWSGVEWLPVEGVS